MILHRYLALEEHRALVFSRQVSLTKLQVITRDRSSYLKGKNIAQIKKRPKEGYSSVFMLDAMLFSFLRVC